MNSLDINLYHNIANYLSYIDILSVKCINKFLYNNFNVISFSKYQNKMLLYLINKVAILYSEDDILHKYIGYDIHYEAVIIKFMTTLVNKRTIILTDNIERWKYINNIYNIGANINIMHNENIYNIHKINIMKHVNALFYQYDYICRDWNNKHILTINNINLYKIKHTGNMCIKKNKKVDVSIHNLYNMYIIKHYINSLNENTIIVYNNNIDKNLLTCITKLFKEKNISNDAWKNYMNINKCLPDFYNKNLIIMINDPSNNLCIRSMMVFLSYYVYINKNTNIDIQIYNIGSFIISHIGKDMLSFLIEYFSLYKINECIYKYIHYWKNIKINQSNKWDIYRDINIYLSMSNKKFLKEMVNDPYTHVLSYARPQYSIPDIINYKYYGIKSDKYITYMNDIVYKKQIIYDICDMYRIKINKNIKKEYILDQFVQQFDKILNC